MTNHLDTTVPALSVIRPWAQLIVAHGKTVENRTWTTHRRGRIWIHASKAWQTEGLRLAADIGTVGVSWDQALHPVGIVGSVEIVDVCTTVRHRPGACACGPWAAQGQVHWRLANPVRLARPVPCNGHLGLWWPTPDIVARIREVHP